MAAKKNVLFLLPYPLHQAPSQRFRVENLLFLLDERNISYDIESFMTNNTWKIIYRQGNIIQKVIGICQSFLRRWGVMVCKAKNYDFIFIHREATPLGPPLVEWYLKKVLHKKIIFDFDDAIWIPNTSAQNRIAGFTKAFWKIKYLCKWSWKVSAGNDFLCAFARNSGAENVIRIPTVVDMERRYNRVKEHHNHKLTVGWTGSHSTLKFLDLLIPVLTELQSLYDFDFLVIADKKPDLPLKNWSFCPWNSQTEIEDLLRIDIGVMPLVNDAWSEGKCGFKLIQYLSLGIPAVANSVGVNKQIIESGRNGFLADNAGEWKKALVHLLDDADLRKSMGEAGKNKMLQEYSISSQKEAFLHLFS